MSTLLELIEEQRILSGKMRAHMMTVQFPDKNEHAVKLCDVCRPWFLRSRELITEIYRARNSKPNTPSLPIKQGLVPPE